MKRIDIISFTEQGYLLSQKIRTVLTEPSETDGDAKPDSDHGAASFTVSVYTTKKELAKANESFPVEKLGEWCGENFSKADALIFIGAAGIAVRTIAPFVKDKKTDPAVLVLDELGKHVISLLSGHLGGGNALTLQIAEAIHGDPVITTASDVNGRLAIDVWAQKNNLAITDMKKAKAVAADIVAGKQIPFYCEGAVVGKLPAELDREGTLFDSANAVGISVYRELPEHVLHLVPKAVIVGVGCKRGKAYEELSEFVAETLQEYDLAPQSVCSIASIDLKADEEGLIRLAEEYGVSFDTFSAEILKNVPGKYKASEFVEQTTGVDNVCERAAVAALNEEQREDAEFLLRKRSKNGMTMAIVMKKWSVLF